MKSGWFDRLKEAIAADPRGLRALSRDAGLGVNYVQQMIKDGKEPGTEKLTKLLEALGQGSSVYILTGEEISEQDLEFLRAVHRLNPDIRAEAMRFLQAFQDRTETKE